MKRIISAVVAAVMMFGTLPIFGSANESDAEAVLKNTVVQCWDFSDEGQVSTDGAAQDIPVLSDGAEYNADNSNIRLNASKSAAGLSLMLSEPVIAETADNVINIEFDMNFGSISGQSFTYSVISSGGTLIDFRFEPYKDAGTGYIKIGGEDIISDMTDESGTVVTTVNRQIKNCVSSNTGDGMGAEPTHFRNEIDLISGTAAVCISSGSKSGEFHGNFDAALYNDISSLKLETSKSGSSRHSYIDNIKLSQYQYVTPPAQEELVSYITASADGDVTEVDTSKMVYGDNISSFLVSTAQNGVRIDKYTTAATDSVKVNTENITDIEIAPIYTFSGLEETAFNSADGIILDEFGALGALPDGRYDISFQKADSTVTDIYVNGGMVVNNAEQPGNGRSTQKGSLCEAKDVNSLCAKFYHAPKCL